MRETPISTCERNFLLAALRERKRLDGRALKDRRPTEIFYGADWGSCLACLGDTKVLAAASASVVEPAASRPNEGQLLINVELSPMAAPKFEARGLSEEAVEINRVLERCLKESRCLDMESLCIVAEEKVWCVRLDLHVLNHEGNVVDCASAAGLAALCHFRRPDVTLDGDVVTVHPTTERDPVKLAVHHHPVCTTFAFFSLPAVETVTDYAVAGPPPPLRPADAAAKIDVCDPSRHEEAVMDGKLVLGINPYREICTLHLAGRMLVDKSAVMALTAGAAAHAKTVVDAIKAALAADEAARKGGNGDEVGLAFALKQRMSRKHRSIMTHEESSAEVDFSRLLASTNAGAAAAADDAAEAEVVTIDDGGDTVVEMRSADVGAAGERPISDRPPPATPMDDQSAAAAAAAADVQVVDTVSAEERRKQRTLAEIELGDDDGDDSEEESSKMVVSARDLNSSDDTARGWYKKKW